MKSGVVGSSPADKGKRDEWSEGGVMCLLDEYESKWVLRNRAKLKANDWDEIARHVSLRDTSAKSVKSSTQCKNKIESLKKRYRLESSANINASASPWRFFHRMDVLVKGTPSPQSKLDDHTIPVAVAVAIPTVDVNDGLEKNQKMVDTNNVGDNGIDALDGENHVVGGNCDEGSKSESSKPKRKMGNVGIELGSINGLKRRNGFGSGVAESIRLLAHSMLKMEQGRIAMHKESERLRTEAEVRRAEMEVRRTEIIAQTQLQIAKLFVKTLNSQRDETESSSLRAEPTDMEGDHKNA